MSERPKREDFYAYGTFNGQGYDAAVLQWELEQMGPDFTPDDHYWENGQGTFGNDTSSYDSSESNIPETILLDSPKTEKENQQKINAKKEEERVKKEQEEKKKRIEQRKKEIQETLTNQKKDPLWQSICSSTPILIKAGKKEQARALIQSYLKQKTK